MIAHYWVVPGYWLCGRGPHREPLRPPKRGERKCKLCRKKFNRWFKGA